MKPTVQDAKQDANKTKALELAIANIEKQYGKGSIMKLGDGKKVYEGIQFISTGALSLDIGLGTGGFQRVVLLKFMDQKVLVKQHWLYQQLHRLKRLVGQWLL